jgi:hypothetical protein
MAELQRLAVKALLCLIPLGGSTALAQGVLDQANTTGWGGAAVSIVPSNNAGQSFTPAFDCLFGIELALTTPYPGRGGDRVTVTVQKENVSQPLGSSSAAIPDGFDGYWRFHFSPPLQIKAGEPVRFRVADTGKTVVFWKHAGADPYYPGQAFLHGSRFHANDFLFRTYGGPSTASEAPCRVAQSN